MTQVMLSHPVPSPDVSGAKQWSNSCQGEMWDLKLKMHEKCLGVNLGYKLDRIVTAQ